MFAQLLVVLALLVALLATVSEAWWGLGLYNPWLFYNPFFFGGFGLWGGLGLWGR